MQKESLGRYIASVRKKKGKTQKDLAEALHYTPQAISKLELGDGSIPLDIAISVCKYLDISLDSLFLREEEPKPYDSSVKNLSGLGSKLKAIREETRLSQDGWGDRLGISPKTIRKYEKDEQLPSFLAFEAYCEQKGVLPSDILLSQQVISQKPINKKPTRLVIISAIAAAVAVSAGVGIPLGVFLANKPSSSIEPGVSSSINEPISSSQEEEPSVIESSSESVEEITSETISSSKKESSPEESSESSLEESSPEETSESSIEQSSSEESSSTESIESSEESSESSIEKVYIESRSDTSPSVEISLPDEYKTIFLGKFPQSVVTDENLIAALNAVPGSSIIGNTVEYGDERYLVDSSIAAIKSNAGDPSPVGLHYYRYDPIEWVHCANDDTGCVFVSKDVLFVKEFTDHPVYKINGASEEVEVWNNYEHSSIRAYLNSDFYLNAFKEEERSKILLTNVDNSVETTIDSINKNLSNNTDDYVYLPSCSEMNLGGTNKIYRKARASDYFKAKGGRYNPNSEGAGANNGFYWLRSPYPNEDQTEYERVCSDIGMIYATYPHDSVPYNASFIGDEYNDPDTGPYGIRPMIRLSTFPID